MPAKRHNSVKARSGKRQRTDGDVIDLTKEANGDEILDLTWELPPVQPFRFLDLPSELRLEVYRYLMPYQMKFYFNATNAYGPVLHPPPKRPRSENSRKRSRGGKTNTTRTTHSTHTTLFLVNKFVCNEVRGVLYGDNTFVFNIDASAHRPHSMRSPEIFGPFQFAERMPLLREFRSLELSVTVTDLTHWAVLRHRARLEYFVSVLKEHSDDETQKSLLKKLVVNFVVAHRFDMFGPVIENSTRYGLEGLTSLRGIDEVEVAGAIPDWFSQCLKLRIQGKGGDLHLIDYPDVEVRKRVNLTSKRWKKAFQTTKKWYDPKYNWKEFADRNNIPMSEDDL